MSVARVATSLHLDAFGRPPTLGASAPGRVNLIGEHLDYNGGPVLPVAVERRTAVAVSPAEEWAFVSTHEAGVRRRRPEEPMAQEWSDYLVGVVRELGIRGAAGRGARVAVASDLPIGAGLSSSAALTVAAAAALGELAGARLSPEDLVELAFAAEHDQVGVRVGRMDQTIAAHGREGMALLFETATGALRHVPFTGRYWVIETGTSHRLTGGELNQRRRECEEALARCRELRGDVATLASLAVEDLADLLPRLPAPLDRRVRHVVTETARTRAAAEALAAADHERLGMLLVAGHESLRDDYQSTVPEADLLVESAVRHGAYGARLTGAGWGGAVVLLAPDSRGDEIVLAVGDAFAQRFGRTPEAWSSRAAAGVRAEPLRD